MAVKIDRTKETPEYLAEQVRYAEEVLRPAFNKMMEQKKAEAEAKALASTKRKRKQTI